MPDRAPLTVDAVVELHRERMLCLDMSGQADLFARDGVIIVPFAPGGSVEVRGREAIRAFLTAAGERVRAAGIKPAEYVEDVVHRTASPGVVVSEFAVRAQGVDDLVQYLQVLTVRGGEIVELRDYFTTATAKAKLGPSALPSSSP